ncbi:MULTISPECIES: LysR family transcriptional regulator [unclassified Variovorax]|uniref:LysR family transcriptional regulator n=1 Tax=unclassified Variovorax TaxID=663243 RepID=UPI001BD590DA|nr:MULTISPECIES: LysR family transcriptional regulator [unclassified Variovorax]
MNVTLDQLKAFERIVRLGTFHAAAMDLHLTQPSVSTRIKELESALNVQLFVRNGPRISMTAEGHALIEYADRTLGTVGEIVQRFRTRDPLKGLLRLGMNESFAMISVLDLVRRLEHYYPAIRTSIFVGDTGTVSQMLNEQKLDIAIVSDPNVDAHVTQQSLGKNHFGWFAHSSFAMTRETYTPADLCALHLFISPPTARLHATATNWFASAQVTPERVSTCNSLWVTVQTVLQGLGVGLLPIRVMQAELESFRVKRLPVKPEIEPHNVSICYQTSEFGPGLRTLVDLTRELIEHHKLFLGDVA